MKKFISLFVAFAIAFNFICVQVAAEDATNSGTITCGNKTMSWEVAGNTLKLIPRSVSSQSDPYIMPDYTEGSAPWYPLHEQIERITLDLSGSYSSFYIKAGAYAFYGLSNCHFTSNNLRYLTVNGVSPHAFEGVTFDSFSLDSNAGESAFAGCNFNNCEVKINSGATSIDASAFEGSNVATVDLSRSNLSEIGASVFKDCTSLTTVAGNGRLTKIGSQAFSGCSSLTNVGFISSVQEISDSAFSGSGVQSVTLPANVTVGNNAFKGSALTSVEISGNVSMGIGVFEDCTSLSSVSGLEYLTEIPNNTFKNASSLTSVSLGQDITSIGSGSFANTRLTEVKIPYKEDGSLTIGEAAFSGCYNLTNVVLPPNVTTISDFAFSDSPITSAYVSSGTNIDGANAFLGQTVLLKYTLQAGNTIKIDSITGGDGKVIIPPNLTFGDMSYPINEVDSNYYDRVSEAHTHIDGGSGTCTICGNPCGTFDRGGTTWSVANGTLVISPIGEGENAGKMDPYPDQVIATRPWSGETISALEIKKGIIHIGDYAFVGLIIPEITIPNTVVQIGQGAFSNITMNGVGTNTVFIPPSVTQFGENLFEKTNVDLIMYNSPGLINSLPGDGVVKAHYYVDGDKVYIDNVYDGGVSSYEYPSKVYIDGVEYDVIPLNCDHKFSSEKGDCVICHNVIGGNIGAANPSDVVWYYTDADSTLHIKGTGAIKKFDINNNLYKFLSEEGKYPTALEISNGITEIGDYTFYNLMGVKEVEIPTGVTVIGNSAFEECRGITALTLPDGLTNIGDKAFYNVFVDTAQSQSHVDIPSSVTDMGDDIFGGNTKLYYIAYPENLTPSIDNEIFQLQYKKYTDYVEVTLILPDNRGTVRIPEYICGLPVKKVNSDNHNLVDKDNCDPHPWMDQATHTCPVCGSVFGTGGTNPPEDVIWQYYDSYTDNGVAYPNAIVFEHRERNVYTMQDFTDLNNVPWKDKMTDIKTVIIKNGIQNIGAYAFTGAFNLKQVIFPTDGQFVKIGSHAFENCISLDKVEIPSSVTTLEQDAFCTAADTWHPEITLSETLYNGNLVTSANQIQAVFILHDGANTVGAALTNGYSPEGQLSNLKYPISGNHSHCFNSKNMCILCGNLGGYCGPLTNEQATAWALNMTTGELSINGTGEVGQHPWTTNYASSINNVVIGDGVTGLCESAFENCTNLTSVSFPNTLTIIGDKAFSGTGLSGTFVVSGSVTSIGVDAFSNNAGITHLFVPESCGNSLVNINPPNKDAAVMVYGNGYTEILGMHVAASSTNPNGVAVTIPETLNGITVTKVSGTYNSANVNNITTVNLPGTVTAIGEKAFMKFGRTDDTSPLPFSVTIPESVTSIGASAFEGSAVTSIALPQKVTGIPFKAFYDCKKLTTVNVSAALESIGELAFGACNDLTTVRMTGSGYQCVDLRGTALTSIAESAFIGCQNVKKVVLPKTLTENVPKNVFEGCDNLSIIEIPENVSSDIVGYYENLSGNKTTVIVYRNIEGADRITSAILGDINNWSNIDKDPVSGIIDTWLIVWDGHKHCFDANRKCVLCARQGGKCGETATWVYHENDYKIIINGSGDMWDMIQSTDTSSDDYKHYQEMWADIENEIRTVVINDGITSIGQNAFSKRTELVSVTVPGSLEKIGDNAFGGCSSLVNFDIDDATAASKLTTIGNSAFSGCTKLSKIGTKSTDSSSLPTTLSIIGQKAFENCSSLTKIKIPDGVHTIRDEAFAGCSGLTQAILPLNLATFGNYAFKNCTGLNEIVVPPSISGGEGIFSGCNYLKFAVIPTAFSEANFGGQVTFVKYTITDQQNLTSDRKITEVKPIAGSTVTIPDYIIGSPVTQISQGAFKPDSAFDQAAPTVILPSTLLLIDQMAFKDCTWLKEITLPESLTKIEWQAFYGCTGLKEIVVPENVSVLGSESFSGCSGLEKVTFLSTALTELKEDTFKGCSNLKYMIIPEGVTKIGEHVFRNCTSLEYVTFPISLRNGTVAPDAFDGCTALAAIYAPTKEDVSYAEGSDNGENAESIVSSDDADAMKLRLAVYDQNNKVFKVHDGDLENGRSKYTKVLTIPEGFELRTEPEHFHCFNVNSQCILCGEQGGLCGPNATWTLDKDHKLTIKAKKDSGGKPIKSVIDHDAPEYFGTWTAFKDQIYTLEIEEGITLIDSNAFKGCRQLYSVSLPNTIERLESYAFSGCSALNEIELPDSIITLGEGVFKDDINLRAVDLPQRISDLEKDLFNGCCQLARIKLPENLGYVREGAFSGCIALKEIELPVNTISVNESAFSGCTNLEYIVAPNDCKYTFDEEAFPNATYYKYVRQGEGAKITYARPGANLTELTIPDYIAGLPVVAIGAGVFSPKSMRSDGEISKLEQITISEKSVLKDIEDGAHKGLTSLKKFIVKSNKLETIGNSAFEGCTALEEVILPESVRKIGEKAFYGCKNLKNIPIYEGLLEIGSEAFANSGFKNAFVIIPSTVTTMGEKVFHGVSSDALIAIPQKLANKYSDSHKDNSGSYMFRDDGCSYVIYRVDLENKKWIMEGHLGTDQKFITGFEKWMDVDPNHVHCYYNDACVLDNIGGGDCGADDGTSKAEWTIDRKTKTLKITGSGAMKDYTDENTDEKVAPWREYSDLIEHIVVSEGITRVSTNAFVELTKAIDVKLPSTLTEIGENAFMNTIELVSVTIPDGVSVIPSNAFNGCVKLENVDLPKAIKEIKGGAFKGCSALKAIDIPMSDTSEENKIIIDDSAFNPSLNYVVMPEGTVITAETTSYNRFTYRLDDERSNAAIVKAVIGQGKEELTFPATVCKIQVTTIGGNGQGDVVAGNDKTKIRVVSIPEGVKEIYRDAFTGCENLYSLTLPESLETIGDDAFTGCAVKELIFKDNLKNIGMNAFKNCASLELVKLPLGIESVGTYAFSECSNLDIIVTPKDVVDRCGYTQTASLVYYQLRTDGKFISGAKLGDGKSTIDTARVRNLGIGLDGDHEHCHNSDNVCVLCNEDGGACGNGLEWTLNEGVLEISVKEAVPARSGENIDPGYMWNFTASNIPWKGDSNKITKIVINEGVKSIGNYAFSGLDNLSDITEAFPTSLVKIGENAFKNCTSLSNNVVLHDKITDVATTAFAGCNGLKAIILSNANTAELNTPTAAVLKYRFIDNTTAEITKIENAKEKTANVPESILEHKVVNVVKEYRKYVNPDHKHYTPNDGSECLICGTKSGECGAQGDNLTWYLDEEKKLLIISGQGEMKDYPDSNAPWCQHKEYIGNIQINEGVTYIGIGAFVDMGTFDEITLPPTIETVGYNVFAGTTVKRMYIPSGLKWQRQALFDNNVEKISYKISDDKTYVEVTRIDLPNENSKISIPKSGWYICGLPVKTVGDEFKKFVDQDSCSHDSRNPNNLECLICGKLFPPNTSTGDGDDSDSGSGGGGGSGSGSGGGNGFGGNTGGNTGNTGNNTGNTGNNTGNNGGNTGNNGGNTGNNNGSNIGNNGGNTGNNGMNTSPFPWEEDMGEKPNIINPPTSNIPDEKDFKGTYSLDVEKQDNSLNATIADSTSTIVQAVLTDQERDKLINGNSDVRIILSVTEGDGTVSLRDRAIISAALGEYKLGTYLDISLYKVVDGVRERITRTSTPITVTLDIPNSLKNSGRRFRVIRSHDGSATVLRDLDNSAGTVTIQTDRFSPYAIAYTDSINVSDDYDPPMATGDPGISAFIFVTMASGLTAVGMIYFNHAEYVEVEEEKRKRIEKLIAFGKKGKLQKFIAIPLIFLVTLYYQGIEGIQRNKKNKAED